MAENHVAGKVIVVTGAGSGFGRLLCQRTQAMGARVVAIDVDAAGLDETVAGLPAESYLSVTASVADVDALKAAVAQAVTAFGGVDVMVNNAGTMPLAFYADHEQAYDAWIRCLDVNIKGVLNGIVAVHDQMIEQGRGHVINLSSIYGNFPVSGAGIYGATKAAVNFLSESLRLESQGKIKVTTVRPTGVPATNLGGGIINPEAISGILGINTASYMEKLGSLSEGTNSPELLDPESPQYVALEPQYIVDAIIHAIDQPWGVVIGDVTVRAMGDGYIL
ncbi:MAG: SDR family oxidoreductase [Pseudomonadota bacterium]